MGKRTQSKVKCPECGNADPEQLAVIETFTAYHPIEVDKVGTVGVHNALGMDCPSNHFDDGADDQQGHCRACSHTGALATFGILAFAWV